MQRIVERASKLGISVSEKQAGALMRYCEMLYEANQTLNLTRIPDDPDWVIDRHILDSLTILKCGWPENDGAMIDIGSGAGLPGIPLAVLRPNLEFVLLDAQAKRVAFLQRVIDELHLNGKAVHARAEDAARMGEYRESFDIAVSRAVAGLPVLAEYMLPFVKPGGRMMAMKGPDPEDEVEYAGFAVRELGGCEVRRMEAKIPGRDWRHTVIVIDKRIHTAERYPRRAGIPEKRPLKGDLSK